MQFNNQRIQMSIGLLETDLAEIIHAIQNYGIVDVFPHLDIHQLVLRKIQIKRMLRAGYVLMNQVY